MNFVFQDLHKEINLEVDGKQIELPPIEGSFILFLHSSVCSSFSPSHPFLYSSVCSSHSSVHAVIPLLRSPHSSGCPHSVVHLSHSCARAFPVHYPVTTFVPFLHSLHSSVCSSYSSVHPSGGTFIAATFRWTQDDLHFNEELWFSVFKRDWCSTCLFIILDLKVPMMTFVNEVTAPILMKLSLTDGNLIRPPLFHAGC